MSAMKMAQTTTIKPRKKTPGTCTLRDPVEESAFPIGIRQVSGKKKVVNCQTQDVSATFKSNDDTRFNLIKTLSLEEGGDVAAHESEDNSNHVIVLPRSIKTVRL